ncbi:hypothetical protein Hanom_Chr17g01540831 [Helianthus anomalus]
MGFTKPNTITTKSTKLNFKSIRVHDFKFREDEDEPIKLCSNGAIGFGLGIEYQQTGSTMITIKTIFHFKLYHHDSLFIRAFARTFLWIHHLVF